MIDTTEIRKLAEAATAGPWHTASVYRVRGELDGASGPLIASTERSADTTFIAASRTLVPALCAALDEARLRATTCEQSAEALAGRVKELTRERDEARAVASRIAKQWQTLPWVDSLIAGDVAKALTWEPQS